MIFPKGNSSHHLKRMGEFLQSVVKNGTLHTAVSKEPVLADILIDAGKIVEIAPQINGSFEKVIDASGLDVWPGFVEAHCHIGLDGYGSGNAGADYNETNDPVTP